MRKTTISLVTDALAIFGIVFGLAVILFMFMMLTGCGSDSGSGGSGDPVVVPAVVNVVGFSCVDVANDLVCDSVLDAPGIFNSGPVRISGSPMPTDYIIMDVENDLAVPVSVFVHMPMNIAGCAPASLAFDIVDLEPAESVELSDTLWGYRCGSLAYNETLVTIYNASHFNWWDYASPLDYPRNQALSNSIVRWQNTGAGG